MGCEVNFVNGELERIKWWKTLAAELGFWWMAGALPAQATSHETLKESLSQAISATYLLVLQKNKVKGLIESKMITGTFRTAVTAVTCQILALSRKCKLQRKQKRRLEATG